MIKDKRTLFVDLEVTPIVGYTWGIYDQYVNYIEKHSELICFAYRFEDDKAPKVFSRRLYTEKQLVKMMYEVMANADIIVAHNGDSYDIKMANRFFIKNNLPPLPYAKSVDTKKVAKKYFRFTSNKLDDLGEYLGLGRKLHTDFQLWVDCMRGEEAPLKRMEKYNKQDVDLLHALYMKLRPWHTSHPNHNTITGTRGACTVCGCTKIQKRGYSTTITQRYERLHCTGCGHWFKGANITKETHADNT